MEIDGLIVIFVIIAICCCIGSGINSCNESKVEIHKSNLETFQQYIIINKEFKYKGTVYEVKPKEEEVKNGKT